MLFLLFQGSSDASKVPAFQELKFVVDSKIHAGIREAKAVFQENVSNTCCTHL